MAARYLIRFDDICPGMNWTAWQQVEEIVREAGVRPLLAVVPDNRDPALNVAEPVTDFWDRVRGWQAMGWSIGLHGYQHRYVTHASGIIGRNRYSEFAGLARDEQKDKLSQGLQIFAGHGVRADAWIAPAHSFDETTVELLGELGIDTISDGYALSPYRCERGMLWIPQQFGRFIGMPTGTWTVCLHVNSWTSKDVASFRAGVQRFSHRTVSLDELKRAFGQREKGFEDGVFHTLFRTLRSLRG